MICFVLNFKYIWRRTCLIVTFVNINLQLKVYNDKQRRICYKTPKRHRLLQRERLFIR